MFLHQRANHADQKQLPRTINMHVTTSQNEITSKNHIFSFKTLQSRKNSLQKAAFWHEVKVVCCLLTPFLHAPLITSQCTQVTHNDLAERWSAITRQEGGTTASNVCLQALTLFLLSPRDFFTLFLKQRACSQANCLLVLERLVFIKCTYYTGHAWSLH